MTTTINSPAMGQASPDVIDRAALRAGIAELDDEVERLATELTSAIERRRAKRQVLEFLFGARPSAAQEV